jgi:hypothetical protein
MVTPEIVKPLRDASKTRVATDKGFEKVFSAIKDYKTNEESRARVSLKEDSADAKVDGAKKLDKTGGKDKKDEKKEEKKPSLDPDDDDEKLPLAEDYLLQETLRVAADYVQVLGKRPLAKISLPDMDKISVAEQAAKKADVKVKKTP